MKPYCRICKHYSKHKYEGWVPGPPPANTCMHPEAIFHDRVDGPYRVDMHGDRYDVEKLLVRCDMEGWFAPAETQPPRARKRWFW